MSNFLGQSRRGLIASVATLFLMLASFIAPANAQGSATGAVFLSEMATGSVWVGDIGANPQEKHLFWQAAGSAIDQVAATNTMVAWSSAYTEDNAYKNKVFIAPVGQTAENVVTVNMPYLVQALAADQAGEKFYAISDGRIYKINSDGSSKVQIVSDQANLMGAFWALAIDTTNHKIYATNDENGELYVYQLDANNENGDSGTLLLQDEKLVFSDGLWIDVPGNRIVWTGYNENAGVHQIDLDGSNYALVVDTSSLGTAPTGMIVSNSTSKMFFTTEESFIETDLSGNNSRILYTSGLTESGFEGFAIAFGITLPAVNDPAPSITSISPDHGPIAGGTEVTITGTGFQNGATVLIGGVACAIVSISATEIVCTTGAHAADTVNVKVTNTDDQEDIAIDAYTYEGNGGGGDPAPSITEISPNHGTVAGGTEVTITGTHFQNGATVLIGGVACAIVSISATEIVCTTGAHEADFVNVKVTNPDDQHDISVDAYEYHETNINNGGGGDPGTVVHFNKTIYFGGDSATITSDAQKVLKKIAARIPAGATDIKIKVYSYVKKITSDVKGSALAISRAKNTIKYLKSKIDGATYKSFPNGKGLSTSNTARKAVIKVTYTTPAS